MRVKRVHVLVCASLCVLLVFVALQRSLPNEVKISELYSGRVLADTSQVYILRLSNESIDIAYQQQTLSQNTEKLFIKQRKLLGKVEQYNWLVLDKLKHIHEAGSPIASNIYRFCRNLTEIPKSAYPVSYKRLRGNTKTVWDVIENTSFFLRTNKVRQNTTNYVTTQTLKQLLSVWRNNASSLAALKALRYYDVITSSPGIHTFLLSSRSSQDTHIIDVTLPHEHYYDCYVSAKLKAGRWWIKKSGGMPFSLCQNDCTDDVSAPRRPEPAVPDHYLMTDYTILRDITQCRGRRLPAGYEHVVTKMLLHNSLTADILTSLDVITQGGVVYNEGAIRTADNVELFQFHCYHPEKDDAQPLHELSWNVDIKCEKEVFVISDLWPTSFYHRLVDEIIKLAPFVTFLKESPHVVIHVHRYPKVIDEVKQYLPVFGLRNRLVWGDVKARTIYRPHGNGCMSPLIGHLQVTSSYFQKYARLNLLGGGESKQAATVVLIKRSRRHLTNYDDVLNVASQFAYKTHRELTVFDEAHLPNINTTLEMFHRADVIIAPHGAGLTNMLASRPGTSVIEVHCKGEETRMCYRMMALRLGLRYYAMETTDDVFSFRCSQSGITVNIEELRLILNSIKS